MIPNYLRIILMIVRTTGRATTTLRAGALTPTRSQRRRGRSMPQPLMREATPWRRRPYVSASTNASHEASMMLAPTPTVTHGVEERVRREDDRDLDRRRVDVVGRLAQVDVLVGVDDVIVTLLVAHQLEGAVGDDRRPELLDLREIVLRDHALPG